MLYKFEVTKQKGYRKVDFSPKVEHFWTLYCDLAVYKWVSVTYISWFSDFALYLEGYLMYKHDTLG